MSVAPRAACRCPLRCRSARATGHNRSIGTSQLTSSKAASFPDFVESIRYLQSHLPSRRRVRPQRARPTDCYLALRFLVRGLNACAAALFISPRTRRPRPIGAGSRRQRAKLCSLTRAALRRTASSTATSASSAPVPPGSPSPCSSRHRISGCVCWRAAGSMSARPPRPLAEGDSVGTLYSPLESAQLRFFGGNSNAWGGWFRGFDDIDFRQRSWVEDSGWPFDGRALRALYLAACPGALRGACPEDATRQRGGPRRSPRPRRPVRSWAGGDGALRVQPADAFRPRLPRGRSGFSRRHVPLAHAHALKLETDRRRPAGHWRRGGMPRRQPVPGDGAALRPCRRRHRECAAAAVVE